jgi:predicted transcriptional regulator
LKIKWRNENLKIQLKMNILDYVNNNKNISINNLADYTDQEYILVAAVVDELVDEGLISESHFCKGMGKAGLTGKPNKISQIRL